MMSFLWMPRLVFFLPAMFGVPLLFCTSCSYSPTHREMEDVVKMAMLKDAIMCFKMDHERLPHIDEIAWRTNSGDIKVIYRDGPVVNKQGVLSSSGTFTIDKQTGVEINSLLLDIMNQPYRFVFDRDGNGFVTVGELRINSSVAIWSVGKNGIDEKGCGDDIHSWSKEDVKKGGK